MRIKANTGAYLTGVVLNQADNSLNSTSTIYCIIWLDQQGNADDGKYWDEDDSTWQVAPVAWPECTHTQAGMWGFWLPAGATTGRAGARLHYTFTDNLTEASATVVATQRVVEVVEAYSAWDEARASHTTAGTFGESVTVTSDGLASSAATEIGDAVPTQFISGIRKGF